jgi:hypothetical protein
VIILIWSYPETKTFKTLHEFADWTDYMGRPVFDVHDAYTMMALKLLQYSDIHCVHPNNLTVASILKIREQYKPIDTLIGSRIFCHERLFEANVDHVMTVLEETKETVELFL